MMTSSARRTPVCRPARCAALTALALACAGAAVHADPARGITVDIALTAKAAETLAARHEGMVLMVDYYGWPKKGAEKHGDEVGRIDFGPDEVIGVAGKSGRHHIPAAELDPKRLGWVEGPVHVNVNVASARRSGPDNLLACDFIDEPLGDAEAAVVTLRCGLIEGDPDSPR